MSTSGKVEYRSATLDDADRIAELHTESWRRAYRGMFTDEYLDGDLLTERRAVWRERLTRPPDNQFVLVAESDHAIAGFVCTFGAHDENGSYVDNLHVDHRFRRLGIASALMRRAGEWLASRYPDVGVSLRVLEGNASARSFYATFGATNAGVTYRQVHPGGWANSCLYVWPDPRLLAGGRRHRPIP